MNPEIKKLVDEFRWKYEFDKLNNTERAYKLVSGYPSCCANVRDGKTVCIEYWQISMMGVKKAEGFNVVVYGELPTGHSVTLSVAAKNDDKAEQLIALSELVLKTWQSCYWKSIR